MRRQHDEMVRGLNTEITQLKRSIEIERNEKETFKNKIREIEKTLNRERIENGETINRLNMLVWDFRREISFFWPEISIFTRNFNFWREI